MNVKKYPSSDPHFIEKVRGACRNDYERGMVFILEASGMHVSNLVGQHRGRRLEAPILNDEGDLRWRRVKNERPMSARVPKGDRTTVKWWLDRYVHRRTERAIQYRLKEIGERAGFPDLSPNSFRVWRACRLLDEGMSPHKVKHLLGCSLEVLMENYAQLEDARRVEEAE
jgi:site-specific recombinase XerD